MCGTAAGGFMCFIARRIARPFMRWRDTTPAPTIKAAAMFPPRDSPVCAEAGPPTMAATNKCLAQSNAAARGMCPCAALIGVSHACTPKLERRTRCRYSPRSRRATGPCCQSKPGHVGQDIRMVCDHRHCVEDDDRPLVMMVAQFRDEDWQA